MIVLQALFVLLVVVCLSDAFFKVPKFHYGVHERLGSRTGVIYFEGWGLKIPFIDKIELISLELSEIEVIAIFTTGKKPPAEPQSTAHGTPGGNKQSDGDDDKIEVGLMGS